VRATFGEPRAVLGGGDRGEWSPVWAVGRRVLHTGIDITAPDGTPVYAVQSGTAIRLGRGDGEAVAVGDFAYWHLDGAVPSGTRVVARRTVIGRVERGEGHLHLTRYAAGVLPVNPLALGGIGPYEDTAPPEILALNAYGADGRPQDPAAVRGPVVLAVRAHDVQSTGGARTGLYRLAYRVARPGDPAPPAPVAVLRLDTLPPLPDANRVFTTRSARHIRLVRLWYRLTERPVPDGRWTPPAPGAWEVRVWAWDARGNVAERAFALTAAGAPTSSPAG
jgi:hypothetical protein